MSTRPKRGSRRKSTRARTNLTILGIMFGLTLVAVVLGQAVSSVVERRQSLHCRELLRQVAEAERLGRPSRAEELLQNYLEIRPGDIDVQVRLSHLQARSGQPIEARATALSTLQAILADRPDRVDARRLAAGLALGLRLYDEAIAHAESLLKTVPDDPSVEELLALAALGSQRFAKAAGHFERARNLDPKRFASYARYAALLRRQLHRATDADAVMEQRITTAHDSPRAYLERARYRRAFGLDGVADDVARARALAPADAEVLLEVADTPGLLADPAALAQFRKDLEAALAASPHVGRLYLTEAILERDRGNPARAEEWLRRGIAQAPDERSLRWQLALTLLDTGRADEAEPVVNDLKSRSLRPALVVYLESRLLLLRGRWAAAARGLEGVRQSVSRGSDLSVRASHIDGLLALCYSRLGDRSREVAARRRIVEEEPPSVSTMAALARALTQSGQADEAIPLWRSIAAKFPAARLELARATVSATLRKPPARRRWEGADEALKAADQALPDSPEVVGLRARVLAAQGRTAEARTLLRARVEAHPSEEPSWLALAELAGSPAEARSELDRAAEHLGDTVPLRLARASTWMREPAPGPAATTSEALAKLEAGADRFPAGPRKQLLAGLAAAQVAVGSEEGADRLLAQVVQLDPFDPVVRVEVVERALTSKAYRPEAVIQGLQALRQAEGPGGPWSPLCEVRAASAAARHGDPAGLAAARETAARLVSRRPGWIPAILARAEVEELAGDPARALSLELEAIALGFDDPTTIRRAMERLYAASRYDEAARLMENLREHVPLAADPDLRRLAEDLDLRSRHPERALASARGVVDAGSRDPRDLLSLVHVLLALRRNDEVEPLLRRAVALDEKAPETRVALVTWLASSGKADAARAEARAAAAKLADDRHALALACCYERAGLPDAALDRYRKALAAHPDDSATLRGVIAFEIRSGRMSEAEAHLRMLVGLASGAPDDRAWAGRGLALLLSEGGDGPRCEEALRILDGLAGPGAAGSSDRDSLDNGRVRAIVLSRQPGCPGRKDAIQRLEQLLAVYDDLPAEGLLLARLLDDDGNRVRALEWRARLATTHGERPDCLAAYAIALLRQGETATPTRLLAQLETLAPKELATAEVAARLLVARKDPRAAASRLTQAIEGRPEGDLRHAAEVLEELGLHSDADVVLRRYGLGKQ